MVIDMNANKTRDISVPDGWHVVDVVMASYGTHGYALIVVVLERNHE